MKIKYLLWLITALSILGVVLNIYKLQACFYIWAFTNAVWCARNVYIKEYPQAALFAVYFILAIYGIIMWQ